MKKLKGIVVSKGIVLGKCCFVNKDIKFSKPTIAKDINKELCKFSEAQKRSIQQLESLYSIASTKFSEDDAMIFKTHQMIIKDNNFTDKVNYYIKVFKYNAEYAIIKASEIFINILKNLNDDYISERSDDIKDVMYRLIKNLSNNDQLSSSYNNHTGILAISDLMPSEMLFIDKLKITGILTKSGSQTSHSAIIARNMGLPTIMGVKNNLEKTNGKFAILDGTSGEIIIDPDEKTINIYKKKQQEWENYNNDLKHLIGKPSITADGKQINIFANVNTCHDVLNAIENDSEGIGLFRSEFMYMNKNKMPSEDELFKEYKSALINAKDKPVIIRTLDIGSDKKLDYLEFPKESNPALGLRGSRFCFYNPDIFITQIRALLKASLFGNLHILIPFIVSVSEIIKIKKAIEKTKKDLISEGQSFNKNIPLGIMIETPSSVIISDLLAKEVDFFSIGTNDLVQYTLAFDRNNTHLSEFYNANHISILRMIKNVVDIAHKNNIWVEVCGETASDLTMIDKLIALDVDKLSVNIYNILEIKNKISKILYNKSKKQLMNIIYPQ